MLQPAAWAHSSSPLYHLARVLSASNNTSEVLALPRCINTGPRKSQNSTRCRALLLRCFTAITPVFDLEAGGNGTTTVLLATLEGYTGGKHRCMRTMYASNAHGPHAFGPYVVHMCLCLPPVIIMNMTSDKAKRFRITHFKASTEDIAPCAGLVGMSSQT
jgi:hypothetical protein